MSRTLAAAVSLAVLLLQAAGVVLLTLRKDDEAHTRAIDCSSTVEKRNSAVEQMACCANHMISNPDPTSQKRQHIMHMHVCWLLSARLSCCQACLFHHITMVCPPWTDSSCLAYL